MSYQEHRAKAPKRVGCGVLTISSTRTKKTDSAGAIIKEVLRDTGHEVIAYEVVKDDRKAIRENIKKYIEDPKVQTIITNGGTGISAEDVTLDAIIPLFEKELPGFGELFRYLSYKEIGSAAMLSRATAGVMRQKPILCLPGSPQAVKLAMKKLVVNELAHLVWEAAR